MLIPDFNLCPVLREWDGVEWLVQVGDDPHQVGEVRVRLEDHGELQGGAHRSLGGNHDLEVERVGLGCKILLN